MAVAFDAVSESHTGTTGSTSEASYSWTHTPAGTPKGVVVFTFTSTSSVDAHNAVTYGGVAMTAVPGGFAQDTATEVGSTKAWFLGASIPTGAQTVAVTRNNNAVVCYAIAVTATAGGNTEATGVTLLQENQAPAEVNVDDGSPGTNSLRVAGLFFGGAVPSAGANTTTNSSASISYSGARSSIVGWETTPGQGSRPVGFSAGSDDVAQVALAIKESSVAQGLTPSLFTNTQTFHAPTVAPGPVGLTPSLFTNTQTFHAPTVAPGAVTLTPDLFTNSQTFHSPTVAGGATELTPSLFTNSQTFYGPTVAPGTVTLTPTLFANSQIFYAPTISSIVTLTSSLFTNSQVFYGPTIINLSWTFTKDSAPAALDFDDDDAPAGWVFTEDPDHGTWALN